MIFDLARSLKSIYYSSDSDSGRGGGQDLLAVKRSSYKNRLALETEMSKSASPFDFSSFRFTGNKLTSRARKRVFRAATARKSTQLYSLYKIS